MHLRGGLLRCDSCEAALEKLRYRKLRGFKYRSCPLCYAILHATLWAFSCPQLRKQENAT